MPDLQISTSPRMTWLWAPDTDTARLARSTLDAAGEYWQPAQRGREQLPLVTDVEIGVTALEACQTLEAAGFTFSWHEDQPGDNRGGWPASLTGVDNQG